MAEKLDSGFLRDSFGRIVVTAAASALALAEGEHMGSGFIRDAKQRLVVVGPEGKSIGGSSQNFVTTTPEEFGAKGEAGHDDAKPITEAINKAVELGIANGSYYAEVLFQAKTYKCERVPVEGGATKGNAQIPLPIISPQTQQKFTLVLKGCRDATSGPHWHQEVIQGGGCVIDSMLTSGASGSWGVPSVLGGPTKYEDPGTGPSFSNMTLVTDGLVIRQQLNPPLIGCDTRQIACHNVVKMATLVRGTVAQMNATPPTNEFGIGLYLPITGNNDNNNLDWYTSYGHYTSLIASEHLVANRIASLYGAKGVIIVGVENVGAGGIESGRPQHGGVINYLSSEVMSICHLEGFGNASTRYPIIINMLSCEANSGTFDIIDTNNTFTGEIGWENIVGEPGSEKPPRVSGGKRVKIVNLLQAPGVAAAPAVPASAAEFRNPYWRDAVFTISGGTVSKIEINGVETGFTSGVVSLVAGAIIKLTYTVKPTWTTWMLT